MQTVIVSDNEKVSIGDPITILEQGTRKLALGYVLGFVGTRSTIKITIKEHQTGNIINLFSNQVASAKTLWLDRDRILDIIVDKLEDAPDNDLAQMFGEVFGGVCSENDGEFVFDVDPNAYQGHLNDLLGESDPTPPSDQ